LEKVGASAKLTQFSQAITKDWLADSILELLHPTTVPS